MVLPLMAPLLVLVLFVLMHYSSQSLPEEHLELVGGKSQQTQVIQRYMPVLIWIMYRLTKMGEIFGPDHYWADWCKRDENNQLVYCGIDFAKAKANGVRFVGLKGCDGLEPTPFFHEAYRDATAVFGKYVLIYCWLDAAIYADPKAQATFWYNEVGKLGNPIAIDFERYLDNIPGKDELWASGYRMRELGFRKVLIPYSNWSYWLEHASNSPAWLDIFDGIWLADPDSPVPTPPIWAPGEAGKKAPSPFPDYLIHQYSWTGDPEFYGVPYKKAVDENRIQSEADLARLFGGTIPPEPPEEHMNKITITWRDGATKRAQPYYPATPTDGVLPLGAVVYSDKEQVLDAYGNKWIELTDGWFIATVYGGAPRCTIVPVTVPPVDTISTTLVFDDTGETYKGTLTKQ